MKKFQIVISAFLLCSMLVGCDIQLPKFKADVSVNTGASTSDVSNEVSENIDHRIVYNLSEDWTCAEVYRCEAYYDERITEVIIASQYDGVPVKSIGDSAFAANHQLKSITIPDSVESIGECAFSFCSSLTNITIPDGVERIDNYTFWGCTSLTSISIPDSVTSIGMGAFEECTSLTSITIPDNVTSIGYQAFKGCTNLSSISIPDSVTIFGSDVFDDCPKFNYNEYDNAYYIGNSSNPYLILVKAKSNNITECTINEKTRLIVGDAFSYCTKLKSITIPNSVTYIGSFAFKGCTSLESITLSKNVDSFEGVFVDCTSLKKVFFTGKKEEWGKITIGNDLINVDRYYYSETKPPYIEFNGNFYFFPEYWHYVDGVPTIWEE